MTAVKQESVSTNLFGTRGSCTCGFADVPAELPCEVHMSDSNIPSNPKAFEELPPRPRKPTQTLSNCAPDRQARQHYSMMLDYWIAEAHWQEKRADQLNAELSAFLKCRAVETTTVTKEGT